MARARRKAQPVVSPPAEPDEATETTEEGRAPMSRYQLRKAGLLIKRDLRKR